MRDKFKTETSMDEERAEEHLNSQKPSENKENNRYLKPVRGHRTLASEVLSIPTLYDGFSRTARQNLRL